jgi:hypothetical protein
MKLGGEMASQKMSGPPDVIRWWGAHKEGRKMGEPCLNVSKSHAQWNTEDHIWERRRHAATSPTRQGELISRLGGDPFTDAKTTACYRCTWSRIATGDTVSLWRMLVFHVVLNLMRCLPVGLWWEIHEFCFEANVCPPMVAVGIITRRSLKTSWIAWLLEHLHKIYS